MAAPTTAARVKKTLANPEPAPPPSAVAAGFWGAPVAEGALRTVDGRHPLARVRNRSKFGRGGHEARWLSLTHMRVRQESWQRTGGESPSRGKV